MSTIIQNDKLKEKNVNVTYLGEFKAPELKNLLSERFIITMCKQGACNGPSNNSLN